PRPATRQSAPETARGAESARRCQSSARPRRLAALPTRAWRRTGRWQPSSKQIPRRVADEHLSRSLAAPLRGAANDRDRRASRLAHDEFSGAGELVRDRHHRRLEPPPEGIAAAAIVSQRTQSGHAERDVDDALAPWTAE